MNIRVAKVESPTRLILDKGKNDGVTESDMFLIYGIGEEIKDIKGKSLGMLEIPKGKGRVILLQNTMTTIEALTKNVTKRKTVQRNSIFSNTAFCPSSETVETEEIVIPFDNVEVGDFAKKL